MAKVNRIKAKVARVPEAPGVYFFKDAAGTILYIGKAKSLKKRVSSYFNRKLDGKTQLMVAKIADLEFRLTPSESQAQILEASLIRAHQPRYNIDLKDDKSFPWIKITHEDFPTVSVCRRKLIDPHDAAVYFGPYTNADLLREALKLVRRIFGFRTCLRLPSRPCLYYRLKLCPGPCVKKITAPGYHEIIAQIQLFLDSNYNELIKILTKKMLRASKERKFEIAAGLRDQISALGAMNQKGGKPRGLNGLERLQHLLKLKHLPLKVEGFDISNISGREATGAMVSFWWGQPDKNNYRRFRIKTVSAIDDYAMLKEVVRRRYMRLLAEKQGLPDAILIDGGRGHLSAACAALGEMGIALPIVSIAKDQENIYLNGVREPIRLEEADPALNLIRRIRDEAHRFAVSYHHVLRRKKIIGK